MADQLPITEDALKAALHSLRVEFAEWQLREFPLFGFDAIKQMGMRGLCSQEEADAAIKEAGERAAADGEVAAPGEVSLKREDKPPYGRAMALLRFDGKDGPVFFVMDRKYHTAGEEVEELQSHDSYFFEEHSCPINWLRDCVKVIQDGDVDPHGFLSHVRSVEVPRDFDEDDDDAVRDLFPDCFPTVIDHRQPLPKPE